MQLTANKTTTNVQRVCHPRFYLRFVCLVVALNLVALLVAWFDRGWIAVAVAGFLGPALNAFLFLGALLVIRRARERGDFSLRKHLVISFAVPAVAAVLDFLIIFSMELHGC